MNTSFSKHIVLLLTMCFFITASTISHAQIDVKTNLLNTLVQEPSLAAEFVAGKHFGIELHVKIPKGTRIDYDFEKLETHVFQVSGYDLRLAAKYYRASPTSRGDKAYLSLFVERKFESVYGLPDFFEEDLNFTETSMNSGLAIGYKKIYKNRFILDMNIGAAGVFADERDYANPDFEDQKIAFSVLPVAAFSIGYRIGGRKKELDPTE